MRHAHSIISGRRVCACVTQTLLGAFAQLPGAVASLTLVQLLVRAAAERRSFDAIARWSERLPSAETLRLQLHALLPATTAALDPVVVAALHHRLPKALHRRPRTFIIDVHTKPYYGAKTTPGTFRGQPKASTKTFFAYATLLVMRKGMTYTVGLVPVVNGVELTTIIDQLLQQAATRNLRPRCLLLDRGFYASKVILHLQQRQLPFVMPMIRRGKTGPTDADATGTVPFFRHGRHGWATYTWKARQRVGGQRGPRTAVTNDVCMVARGVKERPWVFACWGMGGRSPQDIAALYQRRFRIETSYRQMREGLAATCSRNAVYRLLLILIAMVLRNLWLWLHWTLFAERRAGQGRILHLEHMRARAMLHSVVRSLDAQLGIAPGIVIPKATTLGG